MSEVSPALFQAVLAQALQRMLAERWDLVLLDVHMPVMDCLDATRKLRTVDLELAGMNGSLCTLMSLGALREVLQERAADHIGDRLRSA